MGVDVADLMAGGPMLADLLTPLSLALHGTRSPRHCLKFGGECTYDSVGILGYILAELEGTQWGHDVAEAAAAYGARGAHDVEKVKGNNQHLEVEFQEAYIVRK